MHQHVDAIKMATHNICLYKEVDKNYIDYNLKTTELLDCALIGIACGNYCICSTLREGVVGWCEGAVYLTSLGRPTDIGLQLGKACYPCSG